MPEPFDGDKLDPESLAKKLAEQLRSSAPKRKRRRPFPTAGVLRGTGIAAIALGIGFGALAALPWVGELISGLGSSPGVEEPDPSFSGQLTPTSSTSPVPENQPAVVAQSTTTTAPATTTTAPRLRRGGGATTTSPTPPTTPTPTTPTVTTPSTPTTTRPTLPPTTASPPTTQPTTPTTTTTSPPPTTTTTAPDPTTTTTTVPDPTTTTTTTTTPPEDPEP